MTLWKNLRIEIFVGINAEKWDFKIVSISFFRMLAAFAPKEAEREEMPLFPFSTQHSSDNTSTAFSQSEVFKCESMREEITDEVPFPDEFLWDITAFLSGEGFP